MHLMEALKIRDVNGLFLRSSSLLYPLQAARRISFKVDMPMNNGQFVKSIEVFVKFEVKIILHLRHLTLLVKQFSEDLFICADASLRKEDSPLRVFALEKMMKMLGTSQYGIILKSIGPSFRVVVVLLKQVELVDMLPVRHRLRGNHKVRQISSEEVEKNGLAWANVTFNRIDYLLHLKLMMIIKASIVVLLAKADRIESLQFKFVKKAKSRYCYVSKRFFLSWFLLIN